MKLISKLIEKYARMSSTASSLFWFHQPRMPRHMIVRD